MKEIINFAYAKHIVYVLRGCVQIPNVFIGLDTKKTNQIDSLFKGHQQYHSPLVLILRQLKPLCHPLGGAYFFAFCQKLMQSELLHN